MDIAEFLLARIAEDEEWAEANPHFSDSPEWVPPFWTRTRAECDAKRRIVEMALDTVSVSQQAAFSRGEVPSVGGLGEVLQFLALPYADDPDYRPEWRPQGIPMTR
jgi:hypothetical protein